MRVWPGQPYPLGATWDGAGVSFAAVTANTPHLVFDALVEASPIPLLSIVEVVGAGMLLGSAYKQAGPWLTGAR